MDGLRIAGVRVAAGAAGIRYQGRDDLVLLALPPTAETAAVFTTNAFCAAPVQLARRHLAAGRPRYLLINSGNANAGTGARGLADAEACCVALGAAGDCAPEAVLPFSTGVIGEYLPVERIAAALPRLTADLREDGWEAAARAIMTTDTKPKTALVRCTLSGGRTASVLGMAKGAGMIRPDMATMLAFLATDAAVPRDLLLQLLQEAVADTFNAISIDGDTSTNDACVLCAAGTLTGASVGAGSDDAAALAAALHQVCDALATAIVQDGEGATKLVGIEVVESADAAEARRVADTIAHSPLVKTALFASDPNWGRILAAVGRAGIAGLDIEGVRIWLDDCLIVSGGGRDPAYTEAAGRAVMAQEAFRIRVALGRGEAAARVLTCDLSYDYVRINAEYRT
ncbi:bifunctional glutamate N-acetyltransferase/amino-acid acetyltransferase ArgJ [Thiohalocapsa sp. ML1]|uniref:bifunctional glutamate N-acetyltransferase/amino-acid acetyltransferase ArgJ n=1 Tax=Thiohalocapsa sp. ML1 TaxID=1431688 RepID=UPI000A58B88A|nr:bifunctional glutamate N-acetyltransferase/amino-acid acetyltransferase ArgJ [Thiohalocapsa sp. ML1]